jgi:hypothetical protein
MSKSAFFFVSVCKFRRITNTEKDDDENERNYVALLAWGIVNYSRNPYFHLLTTTGAIWISASDLSRNSTEPNISIHIAK